MIRELKTFIAVAREGTFAAAGNSVGLTQAAVSAQMQRLEAELGFALFERTGRSSRLNTLGQQTLLRAEELIALYGKLGSHRLGLAPTTIVSIGAIASVQRTLLPDVLAKFHKRTPTCQSRVIPGVSIDLLNRVDAGEIDMAAIIRPPFSLHTDLRWTTLSREPFHLLAPRKVQGDDWAELLTTQPFVRYDRTSFGGRQVDRFLRSRHLRVQDVCEVDELEAIVRLVANGVGVAIVPQTSSQRHWPAAVRAIGLGEHTFHREIGLVHRAHSGLAPAALALAQLISNAYRDASSAPIS
jgi:DNA-binding transcriptional LysR family regulator